MITLGNNIKLGLLYALAVAVIGLGLFSINQTFELLKAEKTLVAQQSTITNQKLAIDGLASDVEYLGGEVESLVKQSELVAALNSEHERQSQLITDTGNDWQNKSNQLQVSEHEPTRIWAAEPLPVDAIGLLSEASRSQNGDSQTTSLHSAATEHGQLRLSATSI
jgi:hypothetical protein